MRNGIGQLVLSAAAVSAAWTVFSAGPSGAVLSNAELLRSSANVTGSGFGTSAATFGLSSGSVGVLDWNTLNVRAGESLNFGSGTWYNAVSGAGASEIAGSILGSGANVYLFNPHGVFFSKGACVDVGTFTAAGFAMSNLDDLIDDPTHAPEFGKEMSGDIDVFGAKFGSGRVNLYGRSVFVEESTFGGALSIGAGDKVAVDNVGGGDVFIRVSGASGDASFVNSTAGKVEIEAKGNVRLESDEDQKLGDISAGKNVSVVAEGAVSVAGRVEAGKNVFVSAADDVAWEDGGLLRAGGNVRVASAAGSVALGDISASKASVSAAGDVTGRLGADGTVLQKGEKACATYRIDADGTVVVSFGSATVDVRGGGGVSLEAEGSLTIAPVAVTTVELDPGSDKAGRPGLIETKVVDKSLGGYQSPAKDVEISVPENLTVVGSIRTLSGGGTVRPDTISLEAQEGNVSVRGSVAAEEAVSLTAGRSVSIPGMAYAGDVLIAAAGGGASVAGRVVATRSAEIVAAKDIRIDGSVASAGSIDLTAGDAVALGASPGSLVSKDIAITVGAAGHPSRYEGVGEDGVLALKRTTKGSSGKLTSQGAVLLVDGGVAGGPPAKVSTMLELEAAAADGNSALPVRDPHAALSASRFTPEDVNAQLPLGTNEVVRDETALARATKEEQPWMLKNVRE